MNGPSLLNWHKRAIAVNPDSQIHYFDHLAPICYLMQIPLLMLDESCLTIVKKYYPDVETSYVKFEEFSPQFLIEHYDISFMSDLWDRLVMRSKFEALEAKYQKRWRNVHCPHGFSDKNFYLGKCVMEDIALIYGDNMIDQIKDYGAWELMGRYVVIGNYRYCYYLERRAFYDEIYLREIQSQFDRPRPTILYAPTWLDLDRSSSYFDVYDSILGKLPDEYNLIVKLHPQSENDDVVLFHTIIGKYGKKRNIAFIQNYPLIFPLLAHADLYIGDMSSIGYDFLAFNRPMFFLNTHRRDPSQDRRLYLFRCGLALAPDDYDQIYKVIEKNLKDDQERFGSIRREVWNYTFGENPRPFEEIQAEIIAACEAPPIE